MTLRTEGDIVLAVNMARDLTHLVVAYLNIWRKHANGKNGVTVPSEPYSVVFGQAQEGRVVAVIVHTQTVTWQEPIYYDVDSYYFQEGFGVDNISGHTSRSEDHVRQQVVTIPFPALLQSAESMEASIKATAERIAKKEAETARARQIAALESQLAELKNTQ